MQPVNLITFIFLKQELTLLYDLVTVQIYCVEQIDPAVIEFRALTLLLTFS